MLRFSNFPIFIGSFDSETFECLLVDEMPSGGRLTHSGEEATAKSTGAFLTLSLLGRTNARSAGMGTSDGLTFVTGGIGISDGRGGCSAVGGKMDDDVLMPSFDVLLSGGGGGNGISVGKTGSDVDWGRGIFGGGQEIGIGGA